MNCDQLGKQKGPHVNSPQKDIVTQLEDLVVHDEEFQELEGELDYFCPFDAIGMINQELNHARFLSYILDPNRPHGFGDKYLNAFLQVVAEHSHSHEDPDGQDLPSSSLRPIDIHLLGLDETRIIREKKEIDLRIELPPGKADGEDGTVLAFELKIRAKESKNQLSKYRDTLRQLYPNHELLCFFLTLDGTEASSENRTSWIPVGLDRVIEKFEVLSEAAERTDEASAFVRAYTRMMRRVHVQDETGKAQKLARSLWHRHSKVLDFLSAQRPDEVREYLDFLIDKRGEICDSLSDGLEVTFRANEIRAKDGWLFLEVAEWTDSGLIPAASDGGALFGISVGRANEAEIHASWTIVEGESEERDKIYDALAKHKLIERRRGRKGARRTSTRKVEFKIDSVVDISKEKIVNTKGYQEIRKFAERRITEIGRALKEQ